MWQAVLIHNLAIATLAVLLLQKLRDPHKAVVVAFIAAVVIGPWGAYLGIDFRPAWIQFTVDPAYEAQLFLKAKLNTILAFFLTWTCPLLVSYIAVAAWSRWLAEARRGYRITVAVLFLALLAASVSWRFVNGTAPSTAWLAASEQTVSVPRQGFAVGPIPADLEMSIEEGLLVTEVDDSGPAAMADLQQGDVILSIDDMPTHTPRQLRRVLETISGDDAMVLEVWRYGETLRLTVPW